MQQRGPPAQAAAAPPIIPCPNYHRHALHLDDVNYQELEDSHSHECLGEGAHDGRQKEVADAQYGINDGLPAYAEDGYVGGDRLGLDVEELPVENECLGQAREHHVKAVIDDLCRDVLPIRSRGSHVHEGMKVAIGRFDIPHHGHHQGLLGG
mmetsp:Transcript_11103/g.20346  ORF Transcript_11103/g.20346 Transcript_11103/m.20346 type:complete len:152 (-) Transcript_11103:2239-2694(-)